MIKYISLSQEFNPPDYTVINLNRDFIPWGIDNLFSERILDLYQSPTHSLLINLKSNLIKGEGLQWDREDIILTNFLNKNNINQLIYKLALDLTLFGGFVIECIWSKDRNIITQIKHMPFHKIRICNPNKVNCNKFLFSFNWRLKHKFKPVEIVEIDPDQKIESPRQLLYFSQYSPNTDFYPLPDYFGSINYIELEKEISIFHINNIKNGLMPSTIISIPNIPSDEEMQAFNDNIKEHFSGTRNAGNHLILFGEPSATGVQMPEITTFPTTNNADIYNTLNDITVQKILSAHRLPSPVLAGIGGAGGLGGNANEILIASELFYNTVIRIYQNQILDEIKKILMINNMNTDIEIMNSQPIKFNLSESLMSQILTINEIRNLVGFEELTPEQTTEIQQNNIKINLD